MPAKAVRAGLPEFAAGLEVWALFPWGKCQLWLGNLPGWL